MKILICLFFITSTSFAFNSDKCYSPDNYKGGWQFSGFTSSTQFTSSFGGCSAIGQTETAKGFIANNEVNLKQEIAIGHGEYLLALNAALLCPPEKQNQLNKSLQLKIPVLLPLHSDSFYQEIINTAERSCVSRP